MPPLFVFSAFELPEAQNQTFAHFFLGMNLILFLSFKFDQNFALNSKIRSLKVLSLLSSDKIITLQEFSAKLFKYVQSNSWNYKIQSIREQFFMGKPDVQKDLQYLLKTQIFIRTKVCLRFRSHF